MERRAPLPTFTRETAIQKVRMAENSWNSRDPVTVSMAYSEDSRWRNRAEFLQSRESIQAFLKRKWDHELAYRLIKNLWAYEGNRIAVCFQYDYHDDSNNWFRAYGNENWEFDTNGLMRRREASINEMPIQVSEREFFWELAPGRMIIQD